MHRFDYHAPATIAEAIDLLHTKGPEGKVLAGGTDLVPQMKERDRHPKYLVSLKNIEALQGISFSAEHGLQVGAATKFGALRDHPMVGPHYPAILQSAKMIGSLQTQNLATIGGNFCNAAPSADAAPAFIVLDATVTIQGPGGSRMLPAKDVMQGPGRTALASDELLTEVTVPIPVPHEASMYARHVPRRELDIAVAGVGVYLRMDDAHERITHARVCLSAVAPTPLLATETEAALVGQAPSEELFRLAGEIAAREAQPIADQRGSVAFRRSLVRALTERTLAKTIQTIRAA